MNAGLYEESAVSVDRAKEEKKWKILHVFQWIFVVITGFGIFLSFLTVPSMIGTGKEQNAPTFSIVFSIVTWLAGVVCFALLAFFFWRFKQRYNVSFDYNFVEDELRISKVFNGKKRRFLHKLTADQMLAIGYEDKPSFERMAAGMNKKNIRYLTPNDAPAEGKYFIYIHYSTSIGKTLYVIECRKELLECLVRAAGRNKFEPQ